MYVLSGSCDGKRNGLLEILRSPCVYNHIRANHSNFDGPPSILIVVLAWGSFALHLESGVGVEGGSGVVSEGVIPSAHAP